MGNDEADKSAKGARHQIEPQLRQILEDHTQAAVTELEGHKDFLLHVATAVQRRFQEDDFKRKQAQEAEALLKRTQDQDIVVVAVNPAQPLLDFAPTTFFPNLPEWDDNLEKFAYTGPTFWFRVYQWASLLKWPRDPTEFDISWLELYQNFRIATQTDVPVNIAKHPGKDWRLRDNHSEALLVPQPLSTRIIAFQQVCARIKEVLPYPFMHAEDTSRVNSVRLLGFGGRFAGLKKRPWMPYLPQTVTSSQACKTGPLAQHALKAVPEVPVAPPLINIKIHEAETQRSVGQRRDRFCARRQELQN